MKMENKTKDQLIYESLVLRKRVDELRSAETECSRAEEALKQSEERYRLLAESAHDYIFTIDRSGTILYVNNQCVKEFRAVAKNIVGKNIMELFPEETANRQKKSVQKVFATGEPLYVEHESAFPSKVLWLDTWLIPLKDGKGRVTSVMGVSRDVTKRKIAELDMEKKERFLASVFSSIQDGISILDKDMNIVRVNPMMESWYSHAMPIIGKKCYRAYHGRSKRCEICPSHKTLHTGKAVHDVVRKIGPEGKPIGWMDLYSFPMKNDTTGKIEGVIEYVRDISGKVEAEHKVYKEKEFMIRVLKGLRDAVAVADEDSECIFVNDALCRLTGYSENELVGQKPPYSYWAEEGLGEIKEYFKKTLEGVSGEYELLFKKKDGNRFFALVSVQSALDPEGNNVFIAAIQDITARKKVEEDILRHREDLEILVKLRTSALETEAAERKKAETEARILKDRIEFILGSTRTGLDIIDSEFYMRYVDPGWAKVYGDWNGRKCYDYFMGAKKACPDCGVAMAFKTKKAVVREETLAKENNRPIQVTTIPFLTEEGEWMVAEVNVDISERKLVEEKLRKSELQQKAILTNIPDIAWLKDKESRFVAVNEAFGKACGIKPESVAGKTDHDIWPKELAERYVADDKEVMKTGRLKSIEEPLADRSGKISWIETIKTPIFDALGAVIGTTGIARDITKRKQAEQDLNIYHTQLEGIVKERTASLEAQIAERKKAEKEKEKLNKELVASNRRMKQLALKDAHTGLFNHRYLGEAVEAEFYRAKRYGHMLSVIMLDIDYFKSINDVYGHDFGDLVLKQFADQLRSIVRKYDVIGRFGGEEFIILSAGVTKGKAINLAQRLLDAITLYNFGNKKHSVKLKLSIAVTSYPDDTVPNGIGLINLADKILGKVKEEGGNKVYSSSELNKKSDPSSPDREEKEADIKELKEKVLKLTTRGNQSVVESIFAFAKTIEAKDHYTGGHVEKTVQYATDIAKALGISSEEIGHIKRAAALHDLGKIGVSEKILLKPSKLTKEEFEQVKKHPQIGADILRPIQFLHDIIPLMLYHHEWWNGQGYPAGLKGEEIPIGARIISIADAYHALTSDRPYRKGFSKKEAIEIIKKGSGTQFDPSLTEIFLKLIRREK